MLKTLVLCKSCHLIFYIISRLVSRIAKKAITHIEIQELVNILEKEKHIAEEEEEEGGNGMLVFAISSLISHLSEYITSQSGIKEE
jgi:hypothetical protein